jgi:uncharacterized membrane protein
VESGTARLEAFSDGVFAIAATLLILDVAPRGGGSLRDELLRAWPAYAAYAISFSTIGIMWINHHTMFRQIGRTDRTFLVLNVAFLMVIAFIPMPTRVLADHLHHDATTAVFFYGLVNVLMAAGYGSVWFYAVRGRRLIADGADPRVVSGLSRAYAPGVPIYAAATLSALISAWLSLGLFAGLALFFALESSLFARSDG